MSTSFGTTGSLSGTSLAGYCAKVRSTHSEFSLIARSFGWLPRQGDQLADATAPLIEPRNTSVT
jgi:hypothetical protein